ncbi:hypothetical protein IJX73_02780 [bacterium]|nr:hypothetical protein [bacterium]
MNLEMIEKLKKCCAREAELRKKVYPKFISTGKMTQQEAEEEIKLMQIAAACFDKILKGNAPEIQQQLFNIEQYNTTTKKSDFDGY